MLNVTLILTTPAGDTLGELPLTEIGVAAPGEITAPRAPGEMTRFAEQVRQVVAAEGLAVAQEPLDLQLTLSRVLLQEPTGETIQVPVTVREDRAGRKDTAGGANGRAGEGPDGFDHLDGLDFLDDLFDLDNLDNLDGADNADNADNLNHSGEGGSNG